MLMKYKLSASAFAQVEAARYLGQFYPNLAPADPRNTKKTVNSSSFFALSGSVSIKALCKHVDEVDSRFVLFFYFYCRETSCEKKSLAKLSELILARKSGIFRVV